MSRQNEMPSRTYLMAGRLVLVVTGPTRPWESSRPRGEEGHAIADSVVQAGLPPVATGSGPYTLHAGLLEKSGDKYMVRASVAHNDLHNGKPHHGPEVQYPLPAEGYSYTRFFDATVRQTEQAVAVIAALKRSNDEKDVQLRALQGQMTLLTQKLNGATTADTKAGPKSAAPSGGTDDSVVVFPSDVEDVKEWVDDILDDPHCLVYHLMPRYQRRDSSARW